MYQRISTAFLSEIPADLTDGEIRWNGTSHTSWDRSDAGRPQPREPEASFELGDDVVHASLGDGVIVGVEPGGVVVVRFAADRSERKLMVDYAPLKKR